MNKFRVVLVGVGVVVLVLGSCGGPAKPPTTLQPIPDTGSATPDEPKTIPPDSGPVEPKSVTRPPPPAPVTTWTIHAIDVGTGLAIFVRGPDFTLLYDAGSNDDGKLGVGNRVLAYLKAIEPNLKKIDHVLLSHPHEDHVELLPDVITNYEIASVWDSGRMHPICGYRRFLDAIEVETDVSYHTVKHPKGSGTVAFKALNNCAGKAKLPAKKFNFNFADQIAVGTTVKLGTEASMKFLHAHADDKKPTGGDLSPNENSLVIRLSLGSHVILLTGDAEGDHDRKTWPKVAKLASAEGRLLACCKDDLKADILIVGHHGSKTSSRTDFLDAVSPEISVISSGPRAYSGTSLPDADVVAALTKRGVVMTTKPTADEAVCKQHVGKIGSDADGKPGGCDNIQITLTSADTKRETRIWSIAD